MKCRTRVRRLGEASAFALLAAGVLAPADAGAECLAVPIISDDGTQVNSVNVTCGTGDTAGAFATSFPFTNFPEFGGSYDGNGDDTVTISGGVITADGALPELQDSDGSTLDPADIYVIEMGNGDNVFEIAAGMVGSPADTETAIYMGEDDDVFIASGGEIYGDIFTDAGADVFEVSGSAFIRDKIFAGTGDNTFTMTGGYVGEVQFEDGNDTVDISGGRVGELVFLGGTNQVTVSGTAEIGLPSSSKVAVEFLGGTNTFSMTGGLVNGSILGGDETDHFEISGGTVIGDIIGYLGEDTVIMRGGVVDGNIAADSVELYGGSISGDIAGLTSTTLVIDDSLSPAPLVLSDGALFSGTDAVGTISNTDLAKFDGNSFASQIFSGFSSLSVSNSTLGFTSSQMIDRLDLSDGSILYVSGEVWVDPRGSSPPPDDDDDDDDDISITAHTSAFGDLYVNSSSIHMINGSTGDTLQVGELTLNNSFLGIDVNQQTGQADQILVAGTFTVTGTNTIHVNLLGTPVLGTTTQIPILIGSIPTGSGTFVVQGIPGTLASLFNYTIVPGAGGGFDLLASPGDLSPVGATQAAIDSQPVVLALDTIDSVMDDAVWYTYGFAGGGTGIVPLSPTFGVFASGQWAHVSHDGFDIVGSGFSDSGPSFQADDFSAVLSFDFNAAKHFDFDDRYGLNIGAFAGYTASNLSLDSYLGLSSGGNADNRSGMFGLYGLFRKGYNYLLVSGTSFLGNTDIANHVLGSTGNYDTAGFAGTASVGRIFVLSQHLRFDLRGGVVGVTFTGDPYTDSEGNDFGESRVSFGALKFEPGIYGEYRLDNGWILSPYARGELQTRFAYRNTGSVEGVKYEFDDSDVSMSLSAGLNLRTSPTSTFSAEIRGKTSTDSSTIAGKIGYKIAF